MNTCRRSAAAVQPWLRQQRQGWTFIELLVTFGLAVLLAAIVAAVFHALIGGMALSAARAELENNVVSALERIIDDIENTVSDTVARRHHGHALRLVRGHAAKDGRLWLLISSPGDNKDGVTAPAQVRYRLQPYGAKEDNRWNLMRQEWEPQRDAPVSLPPENALPETVVGPVDEFNVRVWATNGWHTTWPPTEADGAGRSPAAVRVSIVPDGKGSPPFAVTGTAWRAAAGMLP